MKLKLFSNAFQIPYDKEIINFFENKISFVEMQKLASQTTRNYAKRQLTWFRHQFDEILFCENQQKILENLKNIDLFNHEI